MLRVAGLATNQFYFTKSPKQYEYGTIMDELGTDFCVKFTNTHMTKDMVEWYAV